MSIKNIIGTDLKGFYLKGKHMAASLSDRALKAQFLDYLHHYLKGSRWFICQETLGDDPFFTFCVMNMELKTQFWVKNHKNSRMEVKLSEIKEDPERIAQILSSLVLQGFKEPLDLREAENKFE